MPPDNSPDVIPLSDDLAPFARADAEVAAFACAWLRHLASERRAAALTVESYARDLRQFLAFAAVHFGAAPTLATIAGLSSTDLRAFLAARREKGAGSRSLLRQLAGLRSFAHFLQRSGKAQSAAFATVRAPKAARRLPKPLTAAAACEVANAESRAGEDRPAWVLARDAAVLGLLYGAGLRISEALAIKRGDAPIGAKDTLRVVGKGSKNSRRAGHRPGAARRRSLSRALPFCAAAGSASLRRRQRRPALAAHHSTGG